MRPSLSLLLCGLWLIVLGCKLEDLPGDKRLKTCQTPTGNITAVVDPNNYLKYTFSVSNLGGDVDKVVWTAGGQTVTLLKNESWSFTFTQAGSFAVSASLQNSCNTNASVQSTLDVTPGTPSVVTGGVVSTGATSATVQMSVTSLGGAAGLLEYGVVYAEAPNNNPQRQNLPKIYPGTPALNAQISVTIDNLKPGTQYFFRAYAKSVAGKEGLGSVVADFTTKAASSGTWVRLLGGSMADLAFSIIPLPDGSSIFVGNTASNNSDVTGLKGSYDAWVGRLDASGTLIWKKNLGGSGDDILRSVEGTSDGNFILAGNTSSNDGDVSGNKGKYDAWVVKINSDGVVLWSKTLGGSNDDYGYSAQSTTPDGGCIFVGSTSSNDGQVSGAKGNFDMWVVKLRSDGSIEWQKPLGGTDQEYGYSVKQTLDGGYIAVGTTSSTSGDVASGLNGGFDSWIVKLSSAGALSWEKTLGGAFNDAANCVLQTSNGEYWVTGYEGSAGAPNDAVVYRVTASKTVLLRKLIGGSQKDEGKYIYSTADGGFIFAGSTESSDRDLSGTTGRGQSDAWVVKLNSSGNIDWQKRPGGSGNDYGHCIRPSGDGYLFAGFSDSTDGDCKENKGNNDVFVVKMNASGGY